MERRNKEKVTFECRGTKHESNRIAFSLMSYGSENSRAFIPQTFARCWWQLRECWVSWVVIDERKRERHKDQISSQVVRSISALSWSQQDTRRPQLHLRFLDTGMPFQIAHLPLPSCASLTICIFLCVSIDLYLFPQTNKGVITSPRETGGSCMERDRYFLPSWAHVL